MPATNENIPDKPKFDVYAMLVILTFLFTLGSTLMLNDDLDKNWDFWIKPEQRGERAVHITQMNQDKSDSVMVKVSDTDRKEWELAAKRVYGSDQTFPTSGYEWPAGFDPNVTPVRANADNLKDIPENARNALMAGYKGSTAPVGAPAAEAPKADAPKADAPKDATPPAETK